MKKLVILFSLLLIAVGGFATTINIPADYSTIQAGLNAASEGDIVQVSAGTYTENITWPAVNGIQLIGSGEEDCIIDGNSLASVMRFEEELNGIIDTTTLISNFTITNGNAQGDWPNYNGGGIFCDNSSPTLENVTITNNSASYAGHGGGIYLRDSSPNLENVTITNNSAVYGGGGISCYWDSSPTLENVTITNNSANWGGGIYCDFSSSPSLENVTITNNSAESYGGGIRCSTSSPTLANVTITGNSADSGGGMYCSGSSPSLVDVTITGNSADSGGGMYCSGSSPSLVDVTITGNSADSGGGIYCSSSSSPSLVDVTITGNSADSGGGIYFDYSSPSLVNVTITDNSADVGGGIYCYDNSSPTLENVTITNNSVVYGGGGIYCDWDSNPSFSSENRCNIYSNNTTSRGSGADIFAEYCDLIEVIVDTFSVMTPTDYHASPLDNFTFDILNAVTPQVDTDLYVSPDGDNSNDGLTAESPLKTIQYATSIILVDNTNSHTIHLASGVYSPSTNGEYFPVEVINYVSLVGESEEGVILDAEGVAGVMKCISVTSATISHLTLTNGSADYGGGIYCYDSSPSLANVTITGNSADSQGGGISCWGGSSPSLVNCILWNDTPQEVYVSSSSINISYSNIQGGYSGEGNIDADPLFCDVENDDYHLSWANYPVQDSTMSPCIDAGDPNSPLDPDGTRADMGAYYYYHLLPPNADFASAVTEGYSPLSINFTDLSTQGSEVIIYWQWDFQNDGVIDSYEQNPTHTYYQVDSYDVKLWVSDGTNSDSLTRTNFISVNPPEANFTANTTSGYSPLNVTFSDQSLGNITSWEWDFQNDGIIDSYEQNPTYMYYQSGSYDVKLRISDGTNPDSLLITDFIIVSEGNCVDGYAYLDGEDVNSGIKVLFERVAPSTYTDYVYTDSTGYYIIGLPNGFYDIAYSKDEYYPLPLEGEALYSNTTLEEITLHSYILIPRDYQTIQEGIVNCLEGDTVLVDTGTYYENINFNGKNITVASLYLISQDSSYISQTVIDGSSSGHVVEFSNGEDTTAILSGFTIQNGNADYGGGISCIYSSNPTLENVTITNNLANWGGGIRCYSSSPTLTNVTITNNLAKRGGGIWCGYDYSPTLTNVTITNNSTYDGNGGGIYCYSSSPTLKNVTITDNSASDGLQTSNGGGIYCTSNSSPNLLNTIVSGNEGNYGIYVDSGDPSIAYSNFYNNDYYGNFYNCNQYIGVNITINANGDSCDAYMNIQMDPLFVDAATGDFHLTANSPCINAGDPNLPLDPDGTVADMGAFYYNQGVAADEEVQFITENSFISYPNPITTKTNEINISFSLKKSSRVNIKLYNIKGQLVDNITNNYKKSGTHTISSNINNLSSGIYFIKMDVDGKNRAVKKMILLR